MKRITTIVALLLVISGCIDELNVATDRALRILVVEGSISTDQGPHYILLSKSAKYGTIFEDFSKPATFAFVRVRDQDGAQVILDEVAPGVYATPSTFTAKVNSSYSLVIETSDGQRYASVPEKVVPVPAIKKLTTRYIREPAEVADAAEYGIEIYATFDDTPGEQNYYIWKNKGTYLIKTNPELFTVPSLSGAGGRSPAPKDCCAICWIEEINGDETLRIFSDINSDGNETTHLAAYIRDDGGRYDEKYMIRIRQHSMTKEAYRFFDVLEKQIAISGDLFDPPPATLRGNMINITDSESPVIGYFYASDVSVDSMFLHRALLDNPSKQFSWLDDCLVLKNSTTQRPSYW